MTAGTRGVEASPAVIDPTDARQGVNSII
jgi:hypothetical protein